MRGKGLSGSSDSVSGDGKDISLLVDSCLPFKISEVEVSGSGWLIFSFRFQSL
jgi:hypothetical protein